jgi:hypothetical protein
MSQHEDALSACKTAPRGAAPPTPPSTPPTPPTPHDDAIVARAEANKATADRSILQRLARLYEDSYGPGASATTNARARTRQQEAVVRQLERDATVAETAVNADTNPSSPTATPGAPISQLYKNALLARTAADKAGADLLIAQLCANNKREVGGRSVINTCLRDAYQRKLGWYEQFLQQRQNDADTAEAAWRRSSPGSPPIPRLAF